MALSGGLFFMINIVFGLFIGDALSYERIRHVRRPVPRGIPIRPLDSSTMYRISRRPTEINPDSEPVFLPMHNVARRPLQVMERISTDAKKTWNRPKKDNFNVLNFDAYVMKPNNFNAMKPVTERVLRDTQFQNSRDDLKPSPSSQRKYRTKNGPKKPKKNNHASRLKEYDDLEFYRAYLEHQKHAAMAKKIRPKPEQSARLPIGIEFFEHKKKQKQAYPPITYSPIYMNHLHRSHQHEAVEASNVQHVQMQYPDMHQHEIQVTEENEDIQVTTPFIPILSTGLSTQVEIEKLAVESLPVETTVVEIPTQPEPEPFHSQSLVSGPEMYKFTIDDVVVKPQSPAAVKHPFSGPVTLPPPSLEYKNAPNTHMRPDSISPANSANNAFENPFTGRAHYQTQLAYPSNPFIRGSYRRFAGNRFKNVPIEASASAHQQIQKFPNEPAMMTTMASNDESITSTKSTAHNITAKRIDKRNKKRRLIAEMQKFDNQKINRENPNNLEFSSSYTKRRTQGYANDDEPATTPISSSRSKSSTAEPQYQEMVTTILPKTENAKYFQ